MDFLFYQNLYKPNSQNTLYDQIKRLLESDFEYDKYKDFNFVPKTDKENLENFIIIFLEFHFLLKFWLDFF